MAKSAIRYKNITGGETIAEALRAIPEDLRTSINADVVASGAKPFVIQAKRYAKRSERTGALREAIGMVIRRYPEKYFALAFVGVRRGYYRGKKKLGKGADRKGAESPSHYSHLIEFGHHMVTGGSTRTHKMVLKGTGRYNARSLKEIKKWTKGEAVTPTGKVVGWVHPKPFLRPAFATKKQESLRAMAVSLEKSLKKTIRRLSKRGLYAA